MANNDNTFFIIDLILHHQHYTNEFLVNCPLDVSLLILILVIFDLLAICFIYHTFLFSTLCRCKFAALFLMLKIISLLTIFLLISFIINTSLITNMLNLRFSLENSFCLFIDVIYDVLFSCQDH